MEDSFESQQSAVRKGRSEGGRGEDKQGGGGEGWWSGGSDGFKKGGV